MIVVQYRATVICDNCRKQDVSITNGPSQQTVPLNWIQAMPVGTTQMREFCSAECMNVWQNPIKPWEEDNDGSTTGEPGGDD